MTKEEKRKIILNAVIDPKWWRKTKEYSRKYWRIFILIFFVYLFGSSIVHNANLKDDNLKINRSGKIVDKKQKQSQYESGRIRNIFYMRMKDNNKVEEVCVTNTTYYANSKGDIVNFLFADPTLDSEKNWSSFLLGLSMIGIIVFFSMGLLI